MLLLGGVLFLLTWQQSRMYTDIETLVSDDYRP